MEIAEYIAQLETANRECRCESVNSDSEIKTLERIPENCIDCINRGIEIRTLSRQHLV